MVCPPLVTRASLKEHWREGCICLATEFKYQQAFSRTAGYTFKWAYLCIIFLVWIFVIDGGNRLYCITRCPNKVKLQLHFSPFIHICTLPLAHPNAHTLCFSLSLSLSLSVSFLMLSRVLTLHHDRHIASKTLHRSGITLKSWHFVLIEFTCLCNFMKMWFSLFEVILCPFVIQMCKNLLTRINLGEISHVSIQNKGKKRFS